MNELILELAKQAGIKFPSETDLSPPEKKFAELIVRECLDVVGEENYTMLTGKAYCAQLKRHFGVE